MLCSLSKLDNEKIKSIESAEKKIGKRLLAVNCHDTAAAKLTQEEIAIVSEAEKKLGLVLVAIS